MFDTKLSESRAPMKLSVTVIAKVLACLILFIWLPQTAEAARRMLLGVYYSPVTHVDAMEDWQGKKHAVVNIFTSWCDEASYIDNFFEVQLINLWENGNVPMITWKPNVGCGDVNNPLHPTPDDVEVRAADGEYNVYLRSWAEHLKTFLAGDDGVYGGANISDDRRVYLRLGHEMNGDWYEWGAPATVPGNADNLATDYIDMWKFVKDSFDSKNLNANHVQWVWSVNNEDFPMTNMAEQYYPGDDYVDWVAIDGYNRGGSGGSTWKTPQQVFNDMAYRLRAYPKPLAITEVGSTSTDTAGMVGNVGAKADWITTFFNEAVRNNDVKMVVWFNEDKVDTDDTGQPILNDWAVYSGAYGDGIHYHLPTLPAHKTYSTYRTAVATNNFVSSDVANPRLLTDAQFKGR